MYRTSFESKFGKDEAEKIFNAACEHRDGGRGYVAMPGPGSDEFRWAILITLGYECLTLYAKAHGINTPYSEIEAWLKEPEQRQWLSEHDGDYDVLAMFAGVYNEFMPESTEIET